MVITGPSTYYTRSVTVRGYHFAASNLAHCFRVDRGGQKLPQLSHQSHLYGSLDWRLLVGVHFGHWEPEGVRSHTDSDCCYISAAARTNPECSSPSLWPSKVSGQ